MTDAEAAELARQALGMSDPGAIRVALDRLKRHSFKSSRVPDRELVLYAQGTLEARLGNLGAASVALKKLERQWPRSPFMGEAQAILAEQAVAQKRYKEAETRLHKALASDMPSERKRRPQELLIWTLAEQGRTQEALPIVQALRPLGGQEKPSELGLAGMVEVLAAAGQKDQAQGALKDFQTLYPHSALTARVDLAWGRLLGRTGQAQEAAQVLRKVITDHPGSSQADDARLALASLLTDGSLQDTTGLPSADDLLAEVRRGGKTLPKGTAQVVELRLLVGKSLWEDALNLVDRMGLALRESQPEVHKLWAEAWNAWVSQRLEKGFAGELLSRMKGGCFAALTPESRKGVAELLAGSGLLEVLPKLLDEAPLSERAKLKQAALSKVPYGTQSQAVLNLLPTRGDSKDQALLRAEAEADLGHWSQVRRALSRTHAGEPRIRLLLRLLQRPLDAKESPKQRLAEAEGWLRKVTEKGADREPLLILVADLRLQNGDARGALVLYPNQATAPDQRGWVSLMKAQALIRLGQRDLARTVIREARDEQGFKGQRDALAKSLGAY
jgi:TolA-binding protein